ncbi:MAG: hypothetical protein KGQ61_07310 [Planctomycetes bacterium]|nr:hypothetical protein [Planctomycetota bacterium]
MLPVEAVLPRRAILAGGARRSTFTLGTRGTGKPGLAVEAVFTSRSNRSRLAIEAVLASGAYWSGWAAITLGANRSRLAIEAVLARGTNRTWLAVEAVFASGSNRTRLPVETVLARGAHRPRLAIETVLARWANRSCLAIEAVLAGRTNWSSGPTITLGTNWPRLAIKTVLASRSNRTWLAVETVLSRGPRQPVFSGRSDRPWLAVEAVTARRASRATLTQWTGGTALTLRATGPRDSGSFARAAEAKRFAEAGDQTRGSLVKATEVHPLGVRVVPDPEDAGCLLEPGVTNCTLAGEARRVVDDTEQTMDRRKLAACHGCADLSQPEGKGVNRGNGEARGTCFPETPRHLFGANAPSYPDSQVSQKVTPVWERFKSPRGWR